MKKSDYKQNLDEAKQDLDKLVKRREALDRRIAKLRQDIVSLAQLSGDSGVALASKLIADTKKEFGLKSAVLEALRASDKPLTPAEVVAGIQRLGLSYDSKANLLASVHTTLRRMAQNGEVEETQKDNKKAFRLKSV
jgi:hypothetical protein